MKKLWRIYVLIGAGVFTLVASTSMAYVINLEKSQKTMPGKKQVLPVLLDARPAFDFATGHILNAVNIRWKDYAQTDLIHAGSLDPDYDLLSRKLRILGIAPGVQVTVFGLGPKGDGSEGRIAWMLSFLGIENVQILNYDNTLGKKTVEPGLPNENAPIWLPKTVDSLKINKRDLEALMTANDKTFSLIDVRDEPEYLGKQGAHKGHIKGANNISWKEFFTKTGDVLNSENIVGVFKMHKIDITKTLIFYSNNGVRSGLVTFLAWSAKLPARNYDGSFTEWSADTNAPLE